MSKYRAVPLRLLQWRLVQMASASSAAVAVDDQNVSGSSDRTVRIWDAKTGEPIGKPLTGHDGLVTSVAFSPNGERIVSGSDDKTVWIWDANTGLQIRNPLKGHGAAVTSVAFSKDGERIVSGSRDQTVRIWGGSTGAPIGKPLAGHEAEVLSVAFSPDSQRIVSGSRDQRVRIWDIFPRRLWWQLLVINCGIIPASTSPPRMLPVKRSKPANRRCMRTSSYSVRALKYRVWLQKS
ncbi:MAG: WD40 repeat domain-containing protein [Pseudanabaena sp. RU_4_16]|nr:WD40 repeat domain-containing protein [Pseudanabaena sp. RU_4_16]